MVINSVPSGTNKMERSTIEAYIGIAIAIIAIVFPMTWLIRSILVFVLGCISVDVCFRHPRLISRHIALRLVVCLFLLGVIVSAAWKPIREEYRQETAKSSQSKQQEPAQKANTGDQSGAEKKEADNRPPVKAPPPKQQHPSSGSSASPASQPSPKHNVDPTDEQKAFLRQLTSLYILSHDGITPEMAAGLELPPEDWLNQQLDHRQKNWRIKNGSIINLPLVTPAQQRSPGSDRPGISAPNGIAIGGDNNGTAIVNNGLQPEIIPLTLTKTEENVPVENANMKWYRTTYRIEKLSNTPIPQLVIAVTDPPWVRIVLQADDLGHEYGHCNNGEKCSAVAVRNSGGPYTLSIFTETRNTMNVSMDIDCRGVGIKCSAK